MKARENSGRGCESVRMPQACSCANLCFGPWKVEACPRRLQAGGGTRNFVWKRRGQKERAKKKIVHCGKERKTHPTELVLDIRLVHVDGLGHGCWYVDALVLQRRHVGRERGGV